MAENCLRNVGSGELGDGQAEGRERSAQNIPHQS